VDSVEVTSACCKKNSATLHSQAALDRSNNFDIV